MTMIKMIARKFSQSARVSRGEVFIRYLNPNEKDKILDLGSGTGAHLASMVPFRNNVYIADIYPDLLAIGEEKHGFQTILLDENGQLPFPDKYFDIVFCSSVIEHATLPKNEIRNYRTNNEFSKAAMIYQKKFADEVARVGKRFFVQTPYKYFPIESHTWLPVFFVFLPRTWQIWLIDFLSSWWPKQTTPDWNLLNFAQMKQLFPDAEIVPEKFLGMTKSIMAIKS